MKKLVTISLLIGFAALPALAAEPVPVAPAEYPAGLYQVPVPKASGMQLTLPEAIRLAAERNLDVRAELYNPAISEALVRQSLGIYDSNLTLSSTYGGSDTLSGNFTSVIRSRQATVDAGATQLLPWGTTVGLAFNNTWNSSNSVTNFGRYYDSTLALNFTQPLLKSFGREATELSISVARAGKEGTLSHFRTKLMDTVSQVRTEYYKLYAGWETLEVQKTALALAQKILDENRGRVKAGVLAAMEIQNAEFGVAQREKDLIDAERAVKDEIDVIRNLLRVEEGGDIVPATVPSSEKVPVDVAAEVKKAIANRPELQELRANLRSAELQEKVSNQKVLPDVNLTGSVGTGGVGGSYGRDLDRLSSTNYPLWSVGVAVNYPLGNRAAENQYQQNRLKTERIRTQIRSQEAAIENEVRSAARAVSAGYKQLDVTDRGRVYAEERLNSYIKKNQVGLATTKDVLDVENDLITAKNNQIKARTDYVTALTQLWRATGELLDRAGVHVSEKAADDLLAGR